MAIDQTKSYVATRMEIPIGESEIPDRAFSYQFMMYEINLPIATRIGKTAFIGCDQIETLELPKVITIDDGAFQFCSSLKTAKAPLVDSIGSMAFAGCSNLVSVEFPSLTSAGIAAFRNCESLTDIDLEHLTTFSNNLLQNCSSLSGFNAPNVTNLGKNVFWGCSSLTDIILPKVTSIGNTPFHECTQIESIDLPSLSRFPNGILGSFENPLPSVKYINLRNAVQLYPQFFQGVENVKCVNLSSFQYGLVNAARYDWWLPGDCDVLCSNGWIETRKTAISTMLKNEGSVLPEDGVAQRQFFKTSGLKTDVTTQSIDLYDPLIGEVMDNSFKDKLNLEKAYFPIAWKIGENAFNGCSNITQIRLPSIYKKTNIGNDVFKNCTKLKYLDLQSMSKEDFQTKKSDWGVPSGCTIICNDDIIVA